MIFVGGSGKPEAERALTLWNLRAVGFNCNPVREDPEKMEKELGSP